MHANARRRRNRIHSLEHEGQVVLDEDRKAKMVFSFFDEIISTPSSCSNTINLGTLELQWLDLAGLREHFTKVKVWNVIQLLPSDKALGPDGLTAHFL
jgi:hypothetical protein